VSVAPRRGAREKSRVVGAPRGEVRGAGGRSCDGAALKEKFIGVGNSCGLDGRGVIEGGAVTGGDGRGAGGLGTVIASGGGFGTGTSAFAAGGGGGTGRGSVGAGAGGAGAGGAAATGGAAGGGVGAGAACCVGAGAGLGAGGCDGGAVGDTFSWGFGSAGPSGVPPSKTIATVDGGGSSSCWCR